MDATFGFVVRTAEAECARDCRIREEGNGRFGILDRGHRFDTRKERHIMASWQPELGRNAKNCRWW